MSRLDKFPHTSNILAPTVLQSKEGGDRLSGDVAYADVNVWVRSANASEVSANAKREVYVTHVVYLHPVDSEKIDESSVIHITAGPSHVGSKFQVKTVGERSAGFGRVWSASVELLSVEI